ATTAGLVRSLWQATPHQPCPSRGHILPPKAIGSHSPTLVINRTPEPPRLRFLASATPHLIETIVEQTSEVCGTRPDRSLKKEPYQGPWIEWVGISTWPHAYLGLVEKPSIVI